jgi:hypothetical protein
VIFGTPNGVRKENGKENVPPLVTDVTTEVSVGVITGVLFISYVGYKPTDWFKK